ncbi:recombination protein O N-terminal domain-containing protein [Candidatus Kaiserbacteria bacterium]|nr:recombination protein O N-terminal domain-containing protein [Candidatus Kaiserbacteria bacterium]
MRFKYETRGIVLSRAPAGEANALIALVTPELGLVRTRAQGVRTSGAKLAAALATFAESDCVLVRGRDTWRIAGAVLKESWAKRLSRAARVRAARVVGLIIRLVAGEAHDTELFAITQEFFEALSELPEAEHEAIEILAALRLLRALGLDAGGIPGENFSPEALAAIRAERKHYVSRINRGLEASGL